MLTLTIPQAKTAIADCLDCDQPAAIWGTWGIGKSQAVAQVARERRKARIAELLAAGHDPAAVAAADAEYPCFVDIRLSMFDAVDLRGIPAIVDGRTAWLRPAIWPEANPFDLETVIFFDEIDRAALSVLNAALQILLDRRIGEHVLPASVRIVAAGNGETDRGTNKLTMAANNRLFHYAVAFDPVAMFDHFERIGVNPLLVAFLRMRPYLGHLSELIAEAGKARDASLKSLADSMLGARAVPSPRQWESVNRFLGLPESRRRMHVAGAVGEAIANEFEAFMRIAGKIPSVAAILRDPTGTPIPNELSAHYAIASALGRIADAGSFDAVETYLGRLPTEFHVMGMHAATERAPELKRHGAYVRFATRNPAMAL